MIRYLTYVWSKFWAGSFGSVLTVIGTVLVGLLATVFFKNIHDSWPITAWNGVAINETSIFDSIEGMHRNAKLFWSTTLLFLITLFFREFHRLRADARVRNELETRLDHLRQVIHVMPPKDFLDLATERFRKNSYETELKLLLGGEKEERELINTAIRNVLESIINLAIQFDPPTYDREPSYTATIFWYRDISDLPTSSEDRKPYWEGAKALAHQTVDTAFFASIDGLLVSDKNLSVDLETSGPSPKSEFTCIGFTAGNGSHTDINLPGVAQCLSERKFHLENDTSEISKKLKQYGQTAKERVANYYRHRPDIKSLLSIPIEGPDLWLDNPVAADGSIISGTVAVISISSNSDGIMGNREKATLYYLEMAPFLNLLDRLCRRRADLDATRTEPFIYNVQCKGSGGEMER